MSARVVSGPPGPAVHLWLATPEAADALDPARLDAAERDAWRRLHSERRRRDWRASRVLLREAVARPDATRSLTHSHGYAALALGPAQGTPGIDLEWLTPRAFLDLADGAYAPAEAAYLHALDDAAARCAAFYELWTLKEACTKALGLPLVDGLRGCRFVDARRRWLGELPTARPWQAIVFAPRPRLRLALVWIAQADECGPASLAIREFPAGAADWPVVRRLGSARPGPAGAC